MLFKCTNYAKKHSLISLSKYKYMTKYNLESQVEYALQVWAGWYLRLISGEVATYPSQSAFLNIPRDKDSARKSKLPPDNELAEYVDIAIKTMEKHHKKLACVLKAHYLRGGESIEQTAIKVGMSKRQYCFNLEWARLWINARLVD